MKCYTYDSDGFYVGESVAAINPLETKLKGNPVYMLSHNQTYTPPPELSSGELAAMVAGSWVLKKDYRGSTVYSVEDKSTFVVDYIGEIKEGFTLTAPGDFDWWNGSEWVADESLEKDYANNKKIEEINYCAEAAIISGFESSALGDKHTYKSDRDDQLNLIGMVTSGNSDFFKCIDEHGVSEYRWHTSEQLIQVLNDGKDVKMDILKRAAELKAVLYLLETAEEKFNLVVDI